MQRWLVLTPPSHEERIGNALVSADIEAELNPVNTAAEIRRAVAIEAQYGGRHFVAVGDDASAGLVLDAVMQASWDERPILGIVPEDGGCDFVRTFGLPQPLEDAVKHLKGDSTYDCDVGLLEGSWGRRYFLNLASAGAIGSRRSRRSEFRLITEKRTYEGKATSVLFANGQFAEGGLRVAPRATVVDGAVDVQAWDIRRRERTLFLQSVARGEHLRDKRVRRVSAATFELATERPWPVEADGTRIGDTPVSGRAVPGAFALKI
ncbi:MAG: diacylglycerol/lipid kinase family protein [Acidimicrobiia bacterium]